MNKFSLQCLLCFFAIAAMLRADDTATATPAAAAAPAPAVQAAVATPVPALQQVRTEMRIIEWQLKNSTDVDFAVLFRGNPGNILSSSDLTLPSQDPLSSAARLFLSGMDTGDGSFEAVIEALETAGKTKILAQPSIITTVGGDGTADPKNKARAAAYSSAVTHNVRIPYPRLAQAGLYTTTATNFRDSGLTLECNAAGIKYDEFVQLQISAVVTDLSGFMRVSKDAQGKEMQAPVLDTRVIQNQVLVRNRSIFISGLLKSTREIERRRGIPWISELPVLKHLTSNKSKDTEVVELVFLVRPEILDPVVAAN